MKKFNMVFWGECVIIALLLLILGVLLKDSKRNLTGEDISARASVTDTSDNQTMAMSETSSISSETTEENSNTPLSLEGMENLKNMTDKKIVVFGDSIWSAARGADGISEYIETVTGATVYNCAIGGTTAALIGENGLPQDWTSDSFNGMIYAARKLVSPEQVIADETVREIIKQVDLKEMDYVIVSYGLNDFFSDVSVYPQSYYEITNYVGALRNGIVKLKENYPNLKIVVVSPTYADVNEEERAFRIGDYVETARGVAAELNVEFLDMFHVLGDSPKERLEKLEDGVHMSSEGRKVYARAVIQFLQNLEARNQETQ